ncbi:MAG TPA: hypothetical protein VK936_10010 [Longimicrobiales bacterium]|nr:hypothetical protein [Longimicrobiales bacterium]
MMFRQAWLLRTRPAGAIAGLALVTAAVIATTGTAGTEIPTGTGEPTATLSAVSVSPNIALVGTTSRGTVSRRTGNMTQVALRSSNTAVATVPTHVWLQRGATSQGFDITAVNGAGGCATISATDPDNTVTAKIYTHQRPPRVAGPVQLKLAHDMPWGRPEYDSFVYGASSFKGLISGSGVAGRTFALRSNTSAVTVPRSVTAGPAATSVEFTASIRGRADCVVITATEGRTSVSRLLIFVDVGG